MHTDNVVAPFVLLSIVIVTQPVYGGEQFKCSGFGTSCSHTTLGVSHHGVSFVTAKGQ